MLLGIVVLFITSVFYLGSAEQHHTIVDDYFLETFFIRLGFNVLIITIIVGLAYLFPLIVARISKQKRLPFFKKMLLIDFLVLLLFAVGFVIVFMYSG